MSTEGSGAHSFVRTFAHELSRRREGDEEINKFLEADVEETISFESHITGTPETPVVVRMIRYKPKKVREMPMGEPVPLIEGAKAPTIYVTRTDATGKRPAQAMAGIFPVPEGTKLSMDDSEPAPIPLFSPDFDLRRYRHVFGNVG